MILLCESITMKDIPGEGYFHDIVDLLYFNVSVIIIIFVADQKNSSTSLNRNLYIRNLKFLPQIVTAIFIFGKLVDSRT